MVKRRKFNGKNLSIAKKALKKVNKLARIVKPEIKYKLLLVNTITPTTTGNVQQMDLIAIGTGQNSRVGLSINMVGIGIRGQWKFNTAGATSQVVRMIVYVDKQQGVDSKATPTSILEQVSPYSYLNQIRRKRFRVLLDKMIVLDNISKFTRIIRWWKKLNFESRYNGSASTDIDKNGIFMLTISSQATNSPSFEFTSLIVYRI